MVNRTRGLIATAMVCLVSLAAAPASSAYERNGIYAVGGNQFIVRVQQRGATVYLRAYRLAGDQWERYATTSFPAGEMAARRAATRSGHGGLVERIYFNGRLIGYSDVDLDNPLNTDLNLGGSDCFSCR
jgi:hypothetical protein